MEELETVQGKIRHVVFHNSETLFTVARFELNQLDEKTITVVGLFGDPDTTMMLNLYGHYHEDPRYGMQFKVQRYEKVLPSDHDALIRYLSSPNFPGVGRKLAKAIVDELQDEVLEKIRMNPDILDDIPKMTEAKKQAIIEGLNAEQDEHAQMMQFFTMHGLGVRSIQRLNVTYGNDAIPLISQNPYRLIEECDGFGFKTADKIAMSLGFDKDDPLRLSAYLVSACMDLCMRTGDTYCNEADLEAVFHKEFPEGDFYHYLSDALMNRKLVQEQERIYPISQYDAEEYISSFLQMFPYEPLDPYSEDILEMQLNALQEAWNITYDEEQIEAVHTFFENPLMILTGGPGTGKTTVIRGMIQLFKMLYPGCSIACCAPTGRAAKRLSELTETEGTTIHSLLQWDLETNTFGRTEEEPLVVDCLIIDEFSMVDSWLFYNLAKACVHVKKICIVGDAEQLPSVSPGCVLSDLIEAEVMPVVGLTHIFRQKEGSEVVQLARDIAEGHLDLTPYSNDLSFIPCSAAQVKDVVIQVVQKALDKGYDLQDIQVLASMYSGVAGIDGLNKALQATFNPPSKDKREIKAGYRIFREGDKILQLKNQPDDDVYNGDIGTLVEIIPASENVNHMTQLVVEFGFNYVYYDPETFINITHAYCVSVHKAQGSEYPIVIMPVVHAYSIMLRRRLVYTGITRARQSLVLLGEESALQKAVDTYTRPIRHTTLVKRIRQKQASDYFDLFSIN